MEDATVHQSVLFIFVLVSSSPGQVRIPRRSTFTSRGKSTGESANGALEDECEDKSTGESANGALNTDWHSKRYIMKLLSTPEYTRVQ